MKHIIVLLLVISSANLNIFSQVDPCYVLTEVLREVDKAVVQGRYDDALRMLEQVKKDTKNKQCPEMKDGVVDFKINDVKERMNKRRKEQPQKSREPVLVPLSGYKQCPDNHHPHMIDLGLPSGTKWACCNVGASKPEDYGGYYAWGETEEKKKYSEKTYIYYRKKSYVYIGSDIAGTQYDVAHVKWGGSWRVPSLDQVEELLENCTCEWTTSNGVKGRRFKSKKNGGCIFLPAAGRWYGGLNFAGNHGYYWSSAQHPSRSGSAYCFDNAYLSFDYRGCGQPVRPVSR